MTFDGRNYAAQLFSATAIATIRQRTNLRGFPLVVFEQPAESVVADKIGRLQAIGYSRRFRLANGQIAEALARPFYEIVGQVLTEQMPQVPLAENDEMLETLAFNTLHPTLGERIQVR